MLKYFQYLLLLWSLDLILSVALETNNVTTGFAKLISVLVI